MESGNRQFIRLIALALASSLVACDSQAPETGEAEAIEPAAKAAVGMDEAPAEKSEKVDKTANMFVTEITDTFNPGLQIGDKFPAIKALYQGDEVMGIDRFVRDRGAIFIAARSVDW